MNLPSRSGSASFRGLRRAGVVALLLAGTRLPAQAPRPTMPDSVRGYIRDAMAAFRVNSVHRAETDWPTLEDSVIARSAGAQSPSDTWRALSWALWSVDRHSHLLPSPTKMAGLSGGTTRTATQPGGRLATAFEPGGARAPAR